MDKVTKKEFHMTTELIALLLVPGIFELANKYKNKFLYVLGIGTIIIDGYLLYDYMRES